MSIYETLSVPLGYVDTIERKQHILLLYDDSAYARLVESQFIKNGLARGETCVYVTPDDSGSIVLKFLEYGVPMQHFQSGKLRVIQIHETCCSGKDMLERSKNDAKKILESLIPPYRIVGRIVPNISTIDGILVQMELEKNAHSCFEDFRGSIMCTYDVFQIEKTRRKKWIEDLCKTHHTVIHATKFGKGRILCTR